MRVRSRERKIKLLRKNKDSATRKPVSQFVAKQLHWRGMWRQWNSLPFSILPSVYGRDRWGSGGGEGIACLLEAAPPEVCRYIYKGTWVRHGNCFRIWSDTTDMATAQPVKIFLGSESGHHRFDASCGHRTHFGSRRRRSVAIFAIGRNAKALEQHHQRH